MRIVGSPPPPIGKEPLGIQRVPQRRPGAVVGDVPVYRSLRRLRQETQRWGLPNRFLRDAAHEDDLGG